MAIDPGAAAGHPEVPRSGGLLWPGGLAGPQANWYHCPEPGCRYGERSMSDGSLAADVCPEHDLVLVRARPDTSAS